MLERIVLFTEASDGKRLADPVFLRKFGHEAPADGHHLLALYSDTRGAWSPVSYVNYREFGGAMLSGGACTDGGGVLRQMPLDEQDKAVKAGGVMLGLKRFAETRFADQSIATFSYCGDDRSWEILQKCGYEALDHPYLKVRWNRRLDLDEEASLVSSVLDLGPF